jgi:predicted CoA-binding protein
MVDVAIKSSDGHPLVYLPHHDYYSDESLREILSQVRSFAMVGASATWKRPSFYAMKYLLKKGYRVVPINPRSAGTEIIGQQVYASIADYPGDLDMVDVFRSSEDAYDITKEVIALKDAKNIKVLWMQLTVRNDKAAELAEAAGLTVIMNRCPKIEFARLSGELGWSGINTKIITAKVLRPPRV